ncbi:MAG: lysine biosynthesis protein LysW [Acidobacteria bacterium]|nr:lysine biosynthesis protein LysW [Acidobacteriota bacterium]
MGNCPECDAEVAVESPEVGELVHCVDCGTELEVITVDPLAFEPAPKVEEDWGE